ncbi:MAG: type IVB secretion system protein IcmW [Gammaproteobacteria bacterium]|nr:type IVB secretion system protein IcmW [Gammaproteobacteria bacterium]
MPDLSNKGAHEYWFKYVDPMIYRVVTFMEGVEDWAPDGDPDFEAAMVKLGAELDNVGGVELQNEDEMIKLAAYVRAARNLRLLQCLDVANPGSAARLLMHAEEVSTSEEDVPGLFLRRNIVFERLRLLGRVFSEERTSLVVKAMEDESNV